MKASHAALAALLLGCGPAVQKETPLGLPPGTFLITAEQIEKSGANTAWQVLKQHAPMLTMREDRNGHPVSIGRRGLFLQGDMHQAVEMGLAMGSLLAAETPDRDGVRRFYERYVRYVDHN